MKKFYHLLFYKIFKTTSSVRSEYDASFISSLIIGFIIVFSLFHVIKFIQFFSSIPEFLIFSIYIMSMLINSYYFMRKSKYKYIVYEVESTKPTIICNAIVYLFICWSVVGAFL